MNQTRDMATFKNRTEADRRLVPKLLQYHDDPHGLILALPRGRVAVGYQLSLALHLPLNVFIAGKIGAPGNPEYAIGAVAETGSYYFNQEAIDSFGLSRHELEQSIVVQEKKPLGAKTYTDKGAHSRTHRRTVLLVDDGIATGSTFMVSALAIRNLRPRWLEGVVPVGPLPRQFVTRNPMSMN